MSDDNLNIRATYYIPAELDLRMQQASMELRLTHGVRVSKSEIVRLAVDLFLSLGPAKIYEAIS